MSGHHMHATERHSAIPAPIRFDWVSIRAGAFLMGSDPNVDQDALPEEMPQHSVTLPEYRISRVPVTVAQFAAFVNATGYLTAAEQDGYAWVWRNGEFFQVDGATWQHPSGPGDNIVGREDHPVVTVSWYDAQMFCRWAGVSLPTEAQWEKAARGADGRIWPWGNTPPDVESCNFAMRSGATTPVDRFPAGGSPFGVLDMAGNVWEWTASLWGACEDAPDFGYPYDPHDGREDEAAPATVQRIMRSGAWGDPAGGIRCALRGKCHPADAADLGGFRVVLRRS